MTRATFRFRNYHFRPDTEPDAEPHTFTMRCAVCDATGPTSERPEDGGAWAAEHLKAQPEHFTYRETITRPHRFQPGAWQ